MPLEPSQRRAAKTNKGLLERIVYILTHDRRGLRAISKRLDQLQLLQSEEKLAETAGLRKTLKGMKDMTAASQAAMARLTAAVAANTTVDGSILELVTRLAADIRENADNPAALNAMADQLEADNAKITAKVLENTPAEEPPAEEEPPVEEPPVEEPPVT